MTRQASSPVPTARRALVVLAAAGAALGAGAATAGADTEPSVRAAQTRPAAPGQAEPQAVRLLIDTIGHVLGPIVGLNPGQAASGGQAVSGGQAADGGQTVDAGGSRPGDGA
ncbi:hypothetical protein ACIBAI_05130 [Streptomyces sp. NPDC051041]|uniref:hypothetical protein n=1 Tax=Streptomyces sp. NPDC051041 TaxID=3365640 RepID=UPI00378FE1CA